MTEKKEAKESPIISLEVVTALSIMKGDFNMKDLRNPLNRTENFEHPSGNVMKELSESDLNSFSAGAGETRWSYVKKKYKLNTTNFLFLCNC